MKKVFMLLLILLTIMSATALAAPLSYENQQIEQTGQTGRISWETGVIEAVGIGVAPSNAKSAAQANALARRAAIIDAQRNLVEVIKGVKIDGDTTMVNLMVDSDVVRTRVSGLLKGYKIVREKFMSDGSYQVVMTVSINGENGLSAIALPMVRPTESIPIDPIKPPDYTVPSEPIRPSLPKPVEPYKPDYISPAVNAIYTGVIIDARGMDLQGAFSPAIYDSTGTIAYGNKNIDINFAISQGMVEYTCTPEMVTAAEKGQSRAGTRPLIIKAIGVRNNCNVIISVADANAMLQYNQSAGFLQRCAVVFER